MLPAKAQSKFTRLLDAEQTAQDLVGATMRRLSDATRAMSTAPESVHPKIEADIARYQDNLHLAQARHRGLADMNARLRYFLQEELGNVGLDDARKKLPKLDKGETLGTAVKRIRLKIGTLTSERSRVAACGLPLSDLKKQADEYVAELAERGRPKLLLGHDRKFNANFTATVETAFATKQDIGAALAWLDPPAFLRRLIEEIEAQPQPSLALSAKERTEKLAALDAELLVLEFEEEAYIEASEVEGPILHRRHDADPRAILGVVVSRNAPAAAKRERVRGEAS